MAEALEGGAARGAVGEAGAAARLEGDEAAHLLRVSTAGDEEIALLARRRHPRGEALPEGAEHSSTISAAVASVRSRHPAPWLAHMQTSARITTTAVAILASIFRMSVSCLFEISRAAEGSRRPRPRGASDYRRTVNALASDRPACRLRSRRPDSWAYDRDRRRARAACPRSLRGARSCSWC